MQFRSGTVDGIIWRPLTTHHDQRGWLCELVRETFPLTPKGIIEHLNLRRPVYRKTAAGGHFGRSEAEFTPGPELTVDAAVAAYRARAAATDAAVWSLGSLSKATKLGDGTDLRWVLVHLINETARHAGHADATRQLLDGTTGE